LTSTREEEALVQHPNARLTPAGRKILVERIAAGMPAAHAADQMGISRQTAHRWWSRYRAEGQAGLHDRPSVPHHSPNRIDAELERRVVRLRRRHGWGPAVIAGHVGLPTSTCWRILKRHGISRLSDLDPPTRRPIRRYEHPHPGSLVHVDIKKIGRIRDGGGWRMLGREATSKARPQVGYEYVHAAVDDHSRLAYAEALPDHRGPTCAAFWRRAAAFFADHGIAAERVMTDNAFEYVNSVDFAAALADTGVRRHVRIRPFRPQTNGKVERFNQTLKREWAYQQLYTTNAARTLALDHFLHRYNHHRTHTAIGGPPIARVNNVPACDN
jgi:transposase InsO family protein